MSQFPPTGSPSPSSPTGSGQLVLIGFVIAIVAVVLMNVYVEMRVAASQEDTVTYFRFNTDKRPGERIEVKDVDTVQIPARLTNAFGDSAVQENGEKRGTPLDGIGETLSENVVEGQMLSYNLFRARTAGATRDFADKGLDEITLNIDSKEQPPNLRPGDFVDLYASIPGNQDARYMRVMEYVKVVDLGDRIRESGAKAKSNKYGSITIYVAPTLSSKLFDIQDRVRGNTFNVTRRDAQAKEIRELKIGGSEEINKAVLDVLNLD